MNDYKPMFVLWFSILGLLVLVMFFSFLGDFLADLIITPLPQCQEDVVLVGIGNFENGRWDSYICGPAVDDYYD